MSQNPNPSLSQITSEYLVSQKPTVPHQWRDYLEIRDKWPFADYIEEFLKSPHILSVDVLVIRWQGIADEKEIRNYMAAPLRRQEREAVQMEIFQNLPPRPHAQIIAWHNYKDVNRMVREADDIDAELAARITKQERAVFGADGKMQTITSERPLTENEVDRKRARLESIVKTRRLLMGEATEIVQINSSTNTLDIEEMIKAELSKNPEFAMLEAAAQGEVLEAEIIIPESEIASFDE